MAAEKPVHPVAWVPPPLLFAVAFVLGLLLQRRLAPDAGAQVPGIVRGIGIVLAAAGSLLILGALGLFMRHRTTLLPRGKTAAVVVQGPYRITRNPMYLGSTIGYIGLTLWLGIWWALALLPIPVVLLDRFIIPMEEAQLREGFGNIYEEYCRRVRRWI